MIKPLLKTLAFTALVPCTVTLWLPWSMLRMAQPVGWSGVGWVLIAGGAALYAWCAGLFAILGRGTPAPIAETKVFVARGPYRVVRNPMYIGVLSVLAGEAIVARSRELAIYAAFVAVAFHLFVVVYEERRLTQRFGEGYRQYCRRTGRWLPKGGL